MTEPRISDEELAATTGHVDPDFMRYVEDLRDCRAAYRQMFDYAEQLNTWRQDCRARCDELAAELAREKEELNEELNCMTDSREIAREMLENASTVRIDMSGQIVALAGQVAALRIIVQEYMENADCESWDTAVEKCRIVLADTAAAADAYRQQVVAPVYAERNRLVAALSHLFPTNIGLDPNEPEWPVILIESPAGQISWHITLDERHSLFAHIYDESGKWDGHDDAEKWRRVAAIRARAQEQP